MADRNVCITNERQTGMSALRNGNGLMGNRDQSARLVERGRLMPGNGFAVRLHDIHRFFQRGSERLDVLSGLTLEVPNGEFLALMGPSGSGKTTLLNLIAGLDKPSQGEVWVGADRISD